MRVDDPTDRLVAANQPPGARRRLAVLAVEDLQIGTAHADRRDRDQDRAILFRRLGHLGAIDRAALPAITMTARIGGSYHAQRSATVDKYCVNAPFSHRVDLWKPVRQSRCCQRNRRVVAAGNQAGFPA